MKKYTTRATKWLAKLILVSIIILAIGIILIIVDSPNVSLQVGFTMFGGLVSVIFLACFFAEKSRALIIDADEIIFPRGIDKNGKTSDEKIFSGGDIAGTKGTVAWASRAGRNAAYAIIEYLK